MVSEPRLLLCDEVTSGLDPKAESEVLQLLQQIARKGNCTVISVTHSLRHLARHDSVTVLEAGRLVFQGSPSSLGEYFGIAEAEQLFPTLTTRAAAEWQERWRTQIAPVGNDVSDPASSGSATTAGFPQPGFATQFATLLQRRWLLFRRNRAQVALQLALLLGFSCLVVIFAWSGLPQIQNLSGISSNALQELLATTAFALRSYRVGSLVSGLVMFQVILLTLIGSNNAAREIAGERAIFEKENSPGCGPPPTSRARSPSSACSSPRNRSGWDCSSARSVVFPAICSRRFSFLA